MDRVRTAFVDATRRADTAGFEYLQLHAGHGSLLASFLSPTTNARDDDYGGSPADRRRFPVEVIDAVRAAWPDAKPLGVTLQAADWVAGGLTLEDAVEVAGVLADRGVDLVAPVAGGVAGAERPHPNADVSGYSDHLRHAVDVRTMATAPATDRDTVDTLVGTGRADCVAFGGRVGE
jgi:anthraniloyl-CoA monooxygenase